MTTHDAIERRDEPGTPPATWLLALRVGVVFGALGGTFRAIVMWLRTSDGLLAALVWVRTAAIAGLAFAALYLIVLRALTPAGKRVESTEQRCILRVKLPLARAFAVALKAMHTIDEALHDVDLTAGTASVEAHATEPFFGPISLHIAVHVTALSDGDESQVVIETRGVRGAMDFGATRALIDRIVHRIDEAIATGHTAAEAMGLDALPVAVRQMFRANGYRVVGLRSLRKEAPAIVVHLMAEGDAPGMAVVLTLPRPVSEASLRAAAERAGARSAAKARVGNGVAILPLVAGEIPGKTAARVHQALLADVNDTATTTRMKWPRR